jgi:hypothetical protein
VAKAPSFQFYPGDWRKDTAVQALDYRERGIWFEMLLLMHESPRKGYLYLNGKPASDEAVARMLGLAVEDYRRSLDILLEYGAARRDRRSGAIYNKRMTEDERIRRTKKTAGQRGGRKSAETRGLLLNQKLKQSHESAQAKPQAKRGSSSSSSSSPSGEEKRDLARSDSGAESSAPEAEAVAGYLPVVGRDEPDYGVAVSMVEGYQESYPGVDVIAQLREMKSWLRSNPTKMKTRRGLPRFINGWLAKEQNKAAMNGSIGPRINPRTGKRSTHDYIPG